MTKPTLNPSDPQAMKDAKSAAPKRSLTPRRRAREYALQGVYQSLVTVSYTHLTLPTKRIV